MPSGFANLRFDTAGLARFSGGFAGDRKGNPACVDFLNSAVLAVDDGNNTQQEGTEIMRAALFAILASITFFGVGCHHNSRRNSGCCGGCQSCGQSAHDQSEYGHMGYDQSAHGHMGNDQEGHSGRPSHVARLPHGYMQQQMQGPGGPQGPTVAYPYYTTRAPRDFLMANPPSIGP